MLWQSRQPEAGFRAENMVLVVADGRNTPLGNALVAARLCALNRWRLAPHLQKKFTDTPDNNENHQDLHNDFSALMLCAQPAEALALLKAWGVLALLLPELKAAQGVEQLGFHHLDVYEHSLEALRQLLQQHPNASLEVRLASLLHDIGKPAAKTWDVARERWAFFGHDHIGANLTENILQRFGFSKTSVAHTVALVDKHMLRLPDDDALALRFARRNKAVLPDLLLVMQADRRAARGALATPHSTTSYERAMQRILTALAFLGQPEQQRVFDGQEIMALLGLQPGKLVGEALRLQDELLLEGTHTKETLGSALQEWRRWRTPSTKP